MVMISHSALDQQDARDTMYMKLIIHLNTFNIIVCEISSIYYVLSVANMQCTAKCSLISELLPHCAGADNSVSSASTTATSQNYEVTTGYYTMLHFLLLSLALALAAVLIHIIELVFVFVTTSASHI